MIAAALLLGSRRTTTKLRYTWNKSFILLNVLVRFPHHHSPLLIHSLCLLSPTLFLLSLTLSHLLPTLHTLTHSLTIISPLYSFIYLVGGCKSTMCKQTTSILMHCNSCYDEFCMVSGCTTTKKLLIHTKTCFIFHSLLRNRLSKRYCFSHSIIC